MPFPTRIARLVLLAAVVAASAEAASPPAGKSSLNLGDTNADLVYTPMNPCRIADTRVAGGFLFGSTLRSFHVVGSASLADQGGNASGCGVPVGATAAELNLVAVTPDALGNLRGAAFPGPVPVNGAVINYQALNPNLNIANAVIMPLCDPTPQPCDFDIMLFANGGGTHVVIDVVGYFKRFPKEELITSVAPGTGMTGGGTAGDVTLGIANSGVGTQQIADVAVTPDKFDATGATAGQTLTFNGSAASWQTPAQGTITGVFPGTGITGGGASGNVTLAVFFEGSGTATTVSRSDHKHYARTIIVSPTGTQTGNGTALLDAVALTSAASATNPYLIKIEPGIYELPPTNQLNVPSYVDVEGSGELSTKITRADSNLQLVSMNAHSQVRSLTAENTGGAGSLQLGVLMADDTSLLNVTVKVASTSSLDALHVTTNATVAILDTTVIANTAGGATAMSVDGGSNVTINRLSLSIASSSADATIGVFGMQSQGTIVADGLNVSATNPVGQATGASLTGSDVTLKNSSFSATAGTTALALKNVDSNISAYNVLATAAATTTSAAALTNNEQNGVAHAVFFRDSGLVATTTGPATTYGVNNLFSPSGMTVQLDNCLIAGLTATIANFPPIPLFGFTPTFAGGSRLEGGPAPNVTCVFVVDETGTGFASTCP